MMTWLCTRFARGWRVNGFHVETGVRGSAAFFRPGWPRWSGWMLRRLLAARVESRISGTFCFFAPPSYTQFSSTVEGRDTYNVVGIVVIVVKM